MPTDVVVTLREIQCRNSGDLSRNTNPYIWPMLLWVDNKVNATCAPPESFRTNLGSGMTRGKTGAIPPEVGVLRGRIDGDLRAMFLVVPLLERSHSSDDMMRAAFAAYCAELPQAVSDNLAKLNDPATQGEAIRAITERVKKKAADAAAGKLGLVGDIAHLLGIADDDSILDFTTAQLNAAEQLNRPRPVFLGFAGTELLSYTDDGTPGNVSDPVTVSHDAWDWFKVVFGSSNRVYAVDPKGQLLSFSDNGKANNIPDATVVGLGGWLDFNVLFTGGDRIYAVDREGRLLSYGDNGQPGNVSDPVIVGFGGWSDFKFLFAGSNRIYAVDRQGRLLSYGDNGQPGNVSDPVVVGFDDWLTFKQVFGGGDRIYALHDTSTPSIAYRIQGHLVVESPIIGSPVMGPARSALTMP